MSGKHEWPTVSVERYENTTGMVDCTNEPNRVRTKDQDYCIFDTTVLEVNILPSYSVDILQFLVFLPPLILSPYISLLTLTTLYISAKKTLDVKSLLDSLSTLLG